MSDQLQASLAENALLLLVFGQQEALLASKLLSPELFEGGTQRRIAQVSLDFIHQFGESPKEHIADLLEDELASKDRKARIYRRLIEDLYANQESFNAPYIARTLSDFVNLQRFKLAITEAVGHIQDGDIEKARAIVLQGAKTKSATMDLGYDAYKDAEDLLADEDIDFISTGVRALDELFIGPEKGTLFMWLANSGIGKSWFMLLCAKAALLDHQKVLYITLEMSAKKVARRFCQMVTATSARELGEIVTPFLEKNRQGDVIGITYEAEHKQSLAADRDYVLRKYKKVTRRMSLRIKQFPTSQLSLDGLVAYLELLEAQENFIPDMVIIDYADLMKLDLNNLRIELGALTKALRGLAIERNFALVTASQANRESVEARVVTVKNMGEAYSKVADSDCVVSLCQIPSEKKLGLMRLLVCKARDEEGGRQVLVTQSLAAGQPALDSTVIREDYWDIVDDLSKEKGEAGGSEE